MNKNVNHFEINDQIVIIVGYKYLDNIINLIDSILKCKDNEEWRIIIFVDKEIDSDSSQIKIKIALNQLYNERITIILRTENYGVGKNILAAIHDLSIDHPNGIFVLLEDDLIVHPMYLVTMKNYLNKFKSNSEIAHINGGSYHLNRLKKGIYINQEVISYGWGSWFNKFQNILLTKSELNVYLSKMNDKDIYKFNFNNGFDYFGHLRVIIDNNANQWASLWYGSLYFQKYYCLSIYPGLIKINFRPGENQKKSSKWNELKFIRFSQNFSSDNLKLGSTEKYNSALIYFMQNPVNKNNVKFVLNKLIKIFIS